MLKSLFSSNQPKDGQAIESKVSDVSLDFAPGLIGLQQTPPSPLPRMVLRGLMLLLLAMLIWSYFGRLDVVAVAEGKLVPVSYLKIVQPSEAGIVREIAIKEGQTVQAGQVLVRMDANLAEADSKTILQELQHQTLQLRRVEAELSGTPFIREKNDAPDMFLKVDAAYQANRRALEDDVAAERATQQKAQSDLASTLEVQHKLEQTLPSYQAQEAAYKELVADGFAGSLMGQDKQRERIEKEQDLRAQEYNAKSLQATITQSNKRLAQVQSDYRQKLEAERVTTFADLQKLQQEWAKQSHKNSLLELKAPQAGVIKDLATHTPGTAVSPGTVLMTLVPNNEALHAEVWLKNEDAGFVHEGQAVKVKLMAYPFQKYGMLDGEVTQVSADATDKPNQQQQNNADANMNTATTPSTYKTIIKLNQQHLTIDQDRLNMTAGMQVAAEIKLADQTVMEYLLSPVRKAFHEAARER
jgi:hemolysin D